MATNKEIRISQLPLEKDIRGLMTVGVNSANQSVKIPIGEVINEEISKVKRTYGYSRIDALTVGSSADDVATALIAENENKRTMPNVGDVLVDWGGVTRVPVVRQSVQTGGAKPIYSFSFRTADNTATKTVTIQGFLYEPQTVVSVETVKDVTQQQISTLDTQLAEEATARLNQDDVLEAKIAQETTARTDAHKTLDGKINKEVSERTSAVSAEQTARTSADSALEAKITAETKARTDADKVLTDNIAKEVTDRTNAVKAEATAREQADSAINTDIQSIKDKGSLFDLFKAAGARLNPDGKTWSMNGITDLTTQELINAYQRRPIGPYLIEVYSNVQPQQKFRTNFPIPSWFNPLIGSANRLCYANSFIEILQIGGTTNMGGSFVVLNSCSEWLRGAKKLRIILGPQFSVGSIKFGKDDFRECQALTDIRLLALQSNIYFQDFPNLNKTSIKHMIIRATPKSSITITLHPTAYAMAIADPEIQAELEKQPNISLAEGQPSA